MIACTKLRNTKPNRPEKIMDHPTKLRRPWLALLLSLLTPGLGQLYNGQTGKAVKFLIAWLFLLLVWQWVVLLAAFPGLLITIIALLAFGLFAIIDAFRSARRLQKITLRPYNRWYVYIVLILVFAVVGEISDDRIVANYKIPSGGLAPTIMPGDHIMADARSYGFRIPFTDAKVFAGPVQRGDLAIFPFPDDPSVDYIKRVIAVGSDTIRGQGTRVYLNGEILDEPYAYYDPGSLARKNSRTYLNFVPISVPEGKLFVMGDNRLNSQDSRIWGFVDASTVKGKALFVYWSHDPFVGWINGYHLERIGTDLQ